MAGKRQSHKKSVAKTATRYNGITHAEKLAFVSRFVRVSDPSNKRQVARKYRELRTFPVHLQKPATAAQQKELKKRGFFVTQKGVIIDGPRNVHREQIKGAKFAIGKDGTVKWSVKQRRDFIVGFTPAEKKEFAKDPDAFIKKKMAELKAANPSLKKARKPQIRLQWGAFQATKDFAPSYFTKQYFSEKKGRGKNKQPAKLDKLTGLHIVIHVPKKKDEEKKTTRKGKKKK